MTKNTNNKKKLIQKILLITISIIALTIIGYIILIPIRNNLDHNRFEKLNTQTKTVFQKIEIASNNTDEWSYKASCTPNMTGWAKTGGYTCTTSISMEKPVTTVQEVNDLQAKYYPIIDNFDGFIQKTELDPQLPNDFGKNFVVSSAEKRYTEKESKIECSYLLALEQEIETPNNFIHSSTIDSNNGKIRIIIDCADEANKSWY